MFTGIIEETGEVVGTEATADGRRVRIASSFTDELDHGQSVAVNGACLTVETLATDSFEVFLSTETLDRTYLDEIRTGDPVNLERALPAEGRLDGHFVQGHVDGVAEVTKIERIDEDWTFGFSLPEGHARYVVEKGSIAVDGISLTVASLSETEFTVAIIPATYELTTLSEASVGDPVHLEVDVIAKYVERLLEGY